MFCRYLQQVLPPEKLGRNHRGVCLNIERMVIRDSGAGQFLPHEVGK